jgi:hypothetical protein
MDSGPRCFHPPLVLRGLLSQIELFFTGKAGTNTPPPHPQPPVPATPHPSTPDPSPTLPPPTARIPIELVRNPKARRYILRVTQDRVIRVTIPRGGTETFARRFITQKADWIQSQLDRMSRQAPPSGPLPWGPGTLVWYRGRKVPLEPVSGGCQLDDQFIALPASLVQGGHSWRPLVERHLRRLAEREFPPLVVAAADRYGVVIHRVSIRSQRTRWGSCSRHKTISLNWRLIQIPEFIRDYLFAHELAHVREMNHSPRFWRVVGEFFPAWRDAEAWLKRHGRDVLG